MFCIKYWFLVITSFFHQTYQKRSGSVVKCCKIYIYHNGIPCFYPDLINRKTERSLLISRNRLDKCSNAHHHAQESRPKDRDPVSARIDCFFHRIPPSPENKRMITEN